MKPEIMDLTDHADRTLIEEELEGNIFVEAGAGSGKTRELVERICAMVDAGVELKSVAAITFTEKAAGELRERVRRRLAERSSTERRRQALNQLDTAPIGTIHSFAARIISEHPIEAGVPPLITVVDELRSQIAFTRRWEAARQKLFTDPSIDNALRILLAVGVSLDHLQNVAADLDANWDRLESHPPQRRPIPAVDLGPLLRQTEEVLARADHCADPADKLLTAFEHIKSWHGRLAEAATEELGMVLELLHAVPQKGFSVGKQINWSGNVTIVQESCKDLAEQAIALRNSFVEPAVQTVTAAMAEVLVEAARERQRSGELEYHDLLIHARDLLVGEGKRAVHRALHDRYRYIMLDEFQDTDPIQAELATRISTTDVCGPDGWEQLQIPPGRLFTVGDPKQSIYRFRRADIATYLAAQRRFSSDAASRIASLETNFRSTGKLLEWINGTFEELIVPSGTIQPEYQALTPDPLRPEWRDEHGPAVSVIGRAGAQPGESGRVSADDMRRQEATDVAAAIRIATGTAGPPAWQKQIKRSDRFENNAVELKDICILIPTRTSLAAMEDALDDAGIEYRAEASSLVYSTQEVTDLLLALRAISNTANEAALVLTLRSTLFGCGDDELFEWKRAGGRWNMFAPAPEGLKDSTVAQSLRYLAALCSDIEVLTPAEIMEGVVTDRRMLEAAVDAPRYRDVWRRLRFVIDQARAWTEATHGGLRDYLVWASVQQEENSRVKEAVVPETDVQAVRIMTIHASKGLEFPMVILAGTGSAPNNQKAAALWDQDSQLQVHFIRDIRSAGYNAAETTEAQFADAERRRLLYVACTRAESHLIVSYYVNAKNSLGQFLRDAADAGSAPDLNIPDELPEPVKVPREVRSVEPFDVWQRSRETWQANSAIISSTSVTTIAKGAGNGRTGEFPRDDAVRFVGAEEDGGLPSFAAPAGEHGKEFGTALHRLLELSDLRETEALDVLAESLASPSGLVDPAGLAERARSALRSTPVQRAAEREHWLELPVVTSAGGITLEGIIDLMYRDDDGTLVIADFKTDISVTQETLESYWRQLSTYARMVERITEQTVSELVLIFCRAGEAEVRRQSRASQTNGDS
ncbi:ATP-dependent helicase/nuclease subunit A [Arthrobacter pascens]|uniref:UvrD-helicase domain-containing protein n=1 Tax=Arthrobacter pascens TaxID=1677 RepID=UPI00277EA88B|nr:UvrD-helicase domain-containing protein [Arthrobacter pascens]MDQ0635082.1 ATP-dependent helicase/nuclease subunit A [Arthrobacter pascens]